MRALIVFLKDFVSFARERRKYWLIPLFIIFALFGGLLILAQGSAVAPFIYTLF